MLEGATLALVLLGVLSWLTPDDDHGTERPGVKRVPKDPPPPPPPRIA